MTKKKKKNREEIIIFLEQVLENRRRNYYEYKEMGDKEKMKEMDNICSELYGILYAIKNGGGK